MYFISTGRLCGSGLEPLHQRSRQHERRSLSVDSSRPQRRRRVGSELHRAQKTDFTRNLETGKRLEQYILSLFQVLNGSKIEIYC
jgi:hypothetical protein